ncbi:MFS transporter [Pelomonas nitida]|uniref:MFS transporter n=1 Tax=Pelomonas nitida TaxID=3299027 RepID=A0ABW7G1E7_9BURK
MSTAAGAPTADPGSERAIRLLFAIQLISMGAMEMSGPFWPVHLRALSASEGLFAFAAVAVYVGPMLGIMLTSAFWGRMGDRHGHKLMMIRALMGLALTQLALAFCADVWAILVLRFVQGACAGFIAPAQAYGVAVVSPLRRARLFAFLQVSTNVGSLTGATVGGLILDKASFLWINAAAALLCTLCATGAWLMLPAAASPTGPAPAMGGAASEPDPHAWRRAPIFGLLVITGLLLMSRMLTQTSFSLYVRSVFGVDNWVAGLCYGLLALGFVASASRWARHFEGKAWPQVLPRIAVVSAACAVLTAVAGFTHMITVFVAIHFAWGLLLGATTPVLTSLISTAAGSRHQGHVLGVVQGTNQFASITGIALGMGFTQLTGLEHIYAFVALFYAMAVLAIVAMRRRTAGTPAATSAKQRPS